MASLFPVTVEYLFDIENQFTFSRQPQLQIRPWAVYW